MISKKFSKQESKKMHKPYDLYTFRRCPYAIRARLILFLIKEPFNSIEVSLKNKPKKMMELSPKGTVPILVLSESQNEVIDESLDIIHWALNKRYPKNWKQLTQVQEKEAQRWQKDLDTKFIPSLNRFKYSNEDKVHEKESERKKLEYFLILMNEKMFHPESILDEPS